MEILRLTEQFGQSALHAAVAVLQEGGVIIAPTETSYGLCGDPESIAAMSATYRIKGRETSKALPLVACDLAQVQKFFLLSPAELKLAETYWPGPLSLLLSPKPSAQSALAHLSQDGVIAVRVSSHPFIQAVTREFGSPITATSANISGRPPCFSGDDVVKTFEDQPQDRQPDLIIDAGRLPDSLPSTIIRMSPDGAVEVVRQGAIEIASP